MARPSKDSNLEERDVVRRNIVKWRAELGAHVTQQDIADLADVSVYSYSRYESGGSVPDREAMRKLGVVFGRSVEDFYKKDPPPADPAKQRAFAVRTKIVGRPPEGMQAELEAVVRKYSHQQMEQHARTKDALRRGKKK